MKPHTPSRNQTRDSTGPFNGPRLEPDTEGGHDRPVPEFRAIRVVSVTNCPTVRDITERLPALPERGIFRRYAENSLTRPGQNDPAQLPQPCVTSTGTQT